MLIPKDNDQTMMLCEQGDMGLFCDAITKEEQKAYNESVERERDSKEER